jgi:hypothetical protein
MERLNCIKNEAMENETWAPVAETKEATETPSHGEHTSIPEKKFMKEALLVSGAILWAVLLSQGLSSRWYL